jgi:hypothetical protein
MFHAYDARFDMMENLEKFWGELKQGLKPLEEVIPYIPSKSRV